MSKTPDRAHIERNLEDMMGNDWREFRAKLVAQERAAVATSANQEEHQQSTNDDPKLAKQGQLGDLFAFTISTIFPAKHQHLQQQIDESKRKRNIFDGDCIGGIVSEDPFVSAAELPLLLPQSKVYIDKHRWAHAIPHAERGSVLIANEKLGGVFHQTVVLIIQHCEKTGSIGVVINRYVTFFTSYEQKSQNYQR